MRVTRLFLNTDLRKSFVGLREVAKKSGVPVGPDSCMLFINSKCTSFKILKANEYVVYYTNNNKRIPLKALRHLPEEFGGTETEMSGAIEKSLREDAKVKFL